MISGQRNQNISCIYCNMRHYQNPAVNMRNRLVTWTEQSVGVAVGCFSSNYVSFSARVLHLLTFSWCSLWPEPFTVFFLLLNICPLSRLQPDLHYRKLGSFGGFLSKCGCLILVCLIFGAFQKMIVLFWCFSNG